MKDKQAELANTLSILRIFKYAYKEENGVITIGEIKDLVDKIDLIEKCVCKQKRRPIHIKRTVGIFGRTNEHYNCPSCLSEIEEVQNYCPVCGQKVYR